MTTGQFSKALRCGYTRRILIRHKKADFETEVIVRSDIYGTFKHVTFSGKRYFATLTVTPRWLVEVRVLGNETKVSQYCLNFFYLIKRRIVRRLGGC